METKPRIDEAPAPHIERIIESLTPTRRREDLIGDLREMCASTPQFLRAAGGIIPGIILYEVRITFNRRIAAGQACILYICFASATLEAPLLPVVIAIGVALSLAAVAEPYRNSGKGPARRITTHSVAAATTILLAEALLAFIKPSFEVDSAVLAVSIGTGVLLGSAYRVLVWGPRRQYWFFLSILIPLGIVVDAGITAFATASTVWTAAAVVGVAFAAASYVAHTIRYSSETR